MPGNYKKIRPKSRLDSALIRERLSIEDCVNHFGLESKWMSGALSILCPFHDDENFGSAFVKGNKLHCFVCGESYTAFDIWMKLSNLNFPEMLEDVAASLNLDGCEEVQGHTKAFPLKLRELQLIGLCRYEKPRTYVKGWDEDGKEVYDSLPSLMKQAKDLFYQDPQMFYRMALGKCSEAYSSYYKKEKEFSVLDEALGKDVIHLIHQAAQKAMLEVKAIRTKLLSLSEAA